MQKYKQSKIVLATRGIGRGEATELRFSLAAFVEDWDQPEMDVYDAELAEEQNQSKLNAADSTE